jgi:hypothetical protein
MKKSSNSSDDHQTKNDRTKISKFSKKNPLTNKFTVYVADDIFPIQISMVGFKISSHVDGPKQKFTWSRQRLICQRFVNNKLHCVSAIQKTSHFISLTNRWRCFPHTNLYVGFFKKSSLFFVWKNIVNDSMNTSMLLYEYVNDTSLTIL